MSNCTRSGVCRFSTISHKVKLHTLHQLRPCWINLGSRIRPMHPRCFYGARASVAVRPIPGEGIEFGRRCAARSSACGRGRHSGPRGSERGDIQSSHQYGLGQFDDGLSKSPPILMEKARIPCSLRRGSTKSMGYGSPQPQQGASHGSWGLSPKERKTESISLLIGRSKLLESGNRREPRSQIGESKPLSFAGRGVGVRVGRSQRRATLRAP